MITEIKSGKTETFFGIMKRIDNLYELRDSLAEIPIIVFSLFARSKKLDAPQKKAIERKLDELGIPRENRIQKTGRFSQQLERVVERLKEILTSRGNSEEMKHG